MTTDDKVRAALSCENAYVLLLHMGHTQVGLAKRLGMSPATLRTWYSVGWAGATDEHAAELDTLLKARRKPRRKGSHRRPPVLRGRDDIRQLVEEHAARYQSPRSSLWTYQRGARAAETRGNSTNGAGGRGETTESILREIRDLLKEALS